MTNRTNTPWKVYDQNGKHKISAATATDAALYLYVAGCKGWSADYRTVGYATRVWLEGAEERPAYQGNVDLVAALMYARQEAYLLKARRRARSARARFEEAADRGFSK